MIHSASSSDQYSRLKVVFFCEILKSGDGRTDVQTARAKIVITTGVTVGRPRGSIKVPEVYYDQY